MEKKVHTSPIAKMTAKPNTSMQPAENSKKPNSPGAKMPSSSGAKVPNGPKPNKQMPISPMPNMPNMPNIPNMPMPNMPMPNMPMPNMPNSPVATKPMEKHEMKQWCKDHMHRYVLAHTKDGWCCDGFVEHIDDERVFIAVPHCCHSWDPRDSFHPYPPIYPYPHYPRGRFVRQAFPLTALNGMTLLSFY